jgi:uncharacterized coiled-coil protein SlyX
MKSLLLLFLLPLTTFAQHRATTVVQIHPARIGINGPSTPNYMADEHKTIVATDTLKIAAVKLYSGQKVDLKHAISDLKKRISTKGRRGTDLIEITADAKTRESAVKMSNAVADAFIKRRNSSEKSRAEKAIKALDAELIAQSKLVAKNREKLTKLIEKHDIPHFEQHQKIEGLKASLAQLEKAQPHQKASILASIKLPGNPVTKPYARYLETLQKFDHLSQTKPSRNRELVATRKELDKARTELRKISESFSLVLKTQAAKPKSKKGDAVDRSLHQESYFQAKEEYEQSRAMLREMQIKQQEARILLKMPRSPVTIHERAK